MKNLKLKYSLALMLLSMVSLSSCSNWLDVSPKSEMKAEDLFSNETGFRDALIGVYSIMITDYSYGAALSYEYVDVLANYYGSTREATSWGNHNFYEASMFEYDDSGEESRISYIWSAAYKAIANINMALECIDEYKDVFTSESVYKLYKGELLALRAYLHFDMFRLFGPVPTEELSELSIPYVKIYTSSPQPQLTEKEFLDETIADLVAARELLVEVDPFGPLTTGSYDETYFEDQFLNRENKMNYWATTVILARVYAYGGMGSEALAVAQEVIGSSSSSTLNSFLSMATTFASLSDSYFSSEMCFSLDSENLDDTVNKYFWEAYMSESNQLTMSSTAKDNIIKETGDLDSDFRNYWFSLLSSGTAYTNIKLVGQYTIPLVRVSELFLIASEYSTGDAQIDYLNRLRYNRGLSGLAYDADYETELYKEYRREFIGEGQLFYFYKRKSYPAIGSSDSVIVSDPNSVYVLPLPVNEVDYGNIQQ